jgi:uncharacterized membrane protein
MDPFVTEWLNLLARWGHMIAGIAWIGTSFYFVALDFSLKKREGLPEGVSGEAWEVHGGGFYNVRKYLSAPSRLPEDLIWFKWEAYLTWVTGFLLLCLQYYLNAGSYLIDPAVLSLLPWQAIVISLGSLAAGWIVYDFLCRRLAVTQPQLLAGLVFALIMAASYGYTQVYSGRGAFIHIGIFIGTLMAANVFAVIIPNQRKITAALIRGEKPDPAFGATGKQRSLHNTYLTLPVLVMMVSNHYAMITDHPQAWILAGLIVVGGVALRHFLLRHEVGDPLNKIAWTLPIIFLALGLAFWLTGAGPLDEDWWNLLLRWGHMIAGTAWIGTSFYFVALDFSLRKQASLPAGVLGEAWEVHGGGFYNVQKYLVAPAKLPGDLIWFKWEAYLTWLTGFLLLFVQYYLNASTYLVSQDVLVLTSWQAIGISIASLIAGWSIYDLMCRSRLVEKPELLALCVALLILVAGYGFTQVFSGRGALIHVGSLIGTIMAANVFLVIIPIQKKTYLTLPVLLMMLSNHYPMITDNLHAWILVGLIVVGGAALRHFLVRVEVGDPVVEIAWTIPIISGTLAAALWFTEPAATAAYSGTVTDEEALTIVRTRCSSCHAQTPRDSTIKMAPKGIALETLDELKRYAQQIETQAVKNKAMPLGNKTGMMTEERAKLGAWIDKQ